MDIEACLDTLPSAPGVYLLRDRRGKVIYVGKAVNLRARVRSYFRASGDDRAWISLLPELVGDIETLITQSGKEALILENELIKRHQPRFNVKLRDDSRFILLHLDPDAAFPRLEVVRRRRKDRARYFGPYHSASMARQTLKLINKHFGLRTCSNRQLKGRTRPCVQGQIGRCPAPCVGRIAAEDYARRVEEVVLFLDGRSDELLLRLGRRMQRAAEALDFETAAGLRDQIAAIRATLERQDVVSGRAEDQDVLGLHRDGDRLTIFVLGIRGGVVRSGESFHFTGQEFPSAELLGSFVAQFYGGGREVPREVLLPMAAEETDVLTERLSEIAGRKVGLRVPRRGHGRKLWSMASRNARHAFEAEHSGRAERQALLSSLRDRLRLARPPRRIECFDISHLGGELTVGSRAVLLDGEPCKSEYRHYRCREAAGGDDYGAMSEVLARRFRDAAPGDEGLPDLLVIDGGKGQLNAALQILAEQGLRGAFDVVGLAKAGREDAAGKARPDRVFRPEVKDPLAITPRRPELRPLQHARDEAHRFGIAYSRKLHRKGHQGSVLDQIPGIGPARRRALLRHFGSLKALRKAGAAEIAEVRGIGPTAAAAIRAYLDRKG